MSALGVAAAAGLMLFASAGPLVDDLDRPLARNQHPARLVSLAPNITEILFAIGGGERVVGVSAYCDHPGPARKLPRVGGFSDPDLEKILALAPDAVLLTSVVQEGIDRALSGVGVQVYTMFPRSVAELAPSIRRLGRFTGAEEGAESLALRMESGFARVRAAVAEIPAEDRVRVFFEVDPSPLVTVTARSFEGSLIELAGGRNIAADRPRSYARIDPEAVVKADPQVIVAAHARSAELPHHMRAGWEVVAAVRAGRICAGIDPDLLVRPGPRAVQGAEALLRCFYPERAGAAGAAPEETR